MTYSSAGLIQATDYNGFVSTLNSVWNSLWGQSAVGTVSAGGTVTATQWASLAGTITNAYIHESGSNPSVSSPSAGQTIGIITNLSTAVSYITTYPYNCYASGSSTTATTTAGAKGSANAAWSIVWNGTVEFASTTQRDYYFNAGGRVFLNFTKTSTGTTNDPTWNALAAACNQLSFTSTSTSKVIAGVTYNGTNKQGGSGTPTILRTDVGYAQLSQGSYTTIFQQYYPTYPYTGSYIQVQAGKIGNSVWFITTWYQPASGYAFEAVNISAGAGLTMTQYPPETTYISASWGTPTIYLNAPI